MLVQCTTINDWATKLVYSWWFDEPLNIDLSPSLSLWFKLIVFLTQPGSSNNLLRFARIPASHSSEGVLFDIVSIICCLSACLCFDLCFSVLVLTLFVFSFPFALFSLVCFPFDLFSLAFFPFDLPDFLAAFFRKRACLSNYLSSFLSSGEPAFNYIWISFYRLS